MSGDSRLLQWQAKVEVTPVRSLRLRHSVTYYLMIPITYYLMIIPITYYPMCLLPQP
jgi:hypothetical protein